MGMQGGGICTSMLLSLSNNSKSISSELDDLITLKLIKKKLKNFLFSLIEHYVFFKSLFSWRNLEKCGRIIIFCQDNLGDALFTTSAIRSLRRAYADVKIDLVADEYNIEIYKNNPYLDKIYIWNRKFILKRDLGYLLRKRKEIKKGNYNIALFFEISPQICNFQAVVSALAGIKKRIGLNPMSEVKYLTHVVKLQEEKYWPEVYGDIIGILGVELDAAAMDINISNMHQMKVEQLLSQLGIDYTKEKLIVIHTGAMNYGIRKNWGDIKFIHLIRKINNSGKYTFLLTGTDKDSERINKILPLEGISIFNIAGKLTIQGTAALLRMCILLITGDTLLLHLGVITKIPIVAIFGPTNFRRMIPTTSKKIKVVRKALPCSPCHKSNRKRTSKTEGWNFCSYSNREQCLDELSVDEVFSACEDILN